MTVWSFWPLTEHMPVLQEKDAMKDTLLLLSGGMDSATALYEFRDRIGLAVGFCYGSKHNEREQACAEQLATLVEIPYRLVVLDFNVMGITSNLLRRGDDIPDGHYADPVMKKTVVPFRNGILLALATGIAESSGLSRVLLSNHSGDHAVYPDCRAAFTEPMSQAIKAGTYAGVELCSPYTHIDKRAIALRGKRLGVPYRQTWSCYKGRDVHCGLCGTCVERKEALQGFDPTDYEA